MNKIKELYSSPITELLVVRFEGNFCGTANGYQVGGGGSYDDGDTNNNDDY